MTKQRRKGYDVAGHFRSHLKGIMASRFRKKGEKDLRVM